MSDHAQPSIDKRDGSAVAELSVEAALLIQSRDIAAKTIAAAGITLTDARREWIVLSLHTRAMCLAEVRPGPDMVERCATTSEIVVCDLVRSAAGERLGLSAELRLTVRQGAPSSHLEAAHGRV